MARSPIQEAGIPEDALLLMTGDELAERVGARLTYEIAVELASTGRAFANYPRRKGRVSKDLGMRDRNLEILRLRIVERMSYTEIGKEVGLSRVRVPQLLHTYFGIGATPHRVSSITIPVEALEVVRESARMHLLSAVEDLSWPLLAGTPDLSDAWQRLDLARELVACVDADDDVEVRLGYRRGPALAEALRKQLDIERSLTDTTDAVQRERHRADVAMIERILSAIEGRRC
jgi:sigma-70-like protein